MKKRADICSKCQLPKWGIAWCANQPCPSGYSSYDQDEAAKKKPRVTEKGELCLACEMETLREPITHNAYSRYCDAYICSGCGVREAVNGFFWSIRALAAGATLNEAGDNFVQSKRLCRHRDDGRGRCVDCGEFL